MNLFPQITAFRGSPDRIHIAGHRGARGILPENSLLGFEFALSVGVNLLEFDVVLTRDEVPVITHNHHLHTPTFRAPDGQFLIGEQPKISSLTYAEIERFDIGRIDGESAYGRMFPEQAQLNGIRVPRLKDLLELTAQPKYSNAYLMLELKSDPDFAADTAYREKLVEIVVQEIRFSGLANRTLLHSFDWDLLAICHRQAPDMSMSFLTKLPDNPDEVGEDSAKRISPDFKGRTHLIPDLVKEAGGVLWCPFVNDVTAEVLTRARAVGLCVAVWTVNEPADIERMIDLRVDVIVTDYPGRVQRHLSDRGFCWQSTNNSRAKQPPITDPELTPSAVKG